MQEGVPMTGSNPGNQCGDGDNIGGVFSDDESSSTVLEAQDMVVVGIRKRNIWNFLHVMQVFIFWKLPDALPSRR